MLLGWTLELVLLMMGSRSEEALPRNCHIYALMGTLVVITWDKAIRLALSMIKAFILLLHKKLGAKRPAEAFDLSRGGT
jgi:hypothetical protein